MGHWVVSILVAVRQPVYKVHRATKFGSCLVLGILTVGLYSLVIKTTETAFFTAVKIRLGPGEFFFLKSELFRCEKVQKGFIQPGRHLRKMFGLQLFKGYRWDPPISKNVLCKQFGRKMNICGLF